MNGGLFGNPTLDAPSPVVVLMAHSACRYPASVDTANRPPRTGIMFTGRLPTDWVAVGLAPSGSMAGPVKEGVGGVRWLIGVLTAALTPDDLSALLASLAKYSPEAVANAIEAARDPDRAAQLLGILRDRLDADDLEDFTAIGLMVSLG